VHIGSHLFVQARERRESTRRGPSRTGAPRCQNFGAARGGPRHGAGAPTYRSTHKLYALLSNSREREERARLVDNRVWNGGHSAFEIGGAWDCRFPSGAVLKPWGRQSSAFERRYVARVLEPVVHKFMDFRRSSNKQAQRGRTNHGAGLCCLEGGRNFAAKVLSDVRDPGLFSWINLGERYLVRADQWFGHGSVDARRPLDQVVPHNRQPYP